MPPRFHIVGSIVVAAIVLFSAGSVQARDRREPFRMDGPFAETTAAADASQIIPLSLKQSVIEDAAVDTILQYLFSDWSQQPVSGNVVRSLIPREIFNTPSHFPYLEVGTYENLNSARDNLSGSWMSGTPTIITDPVDASLSGYVDLTQFELRETGGLLDLSVQTRETMTGAPRDTTVEMYAVDNAGREAAYWAAYSVDGSTWQILAGVYGGINIPLPAHLDIRQARIEETTLGQLRLELTLAGPVPANPVFAEDRWTIAVRNTNRFVRFGFDDGLNRWVAFLMAPSGTFFSTVVRELPATVSGSVIAIDVPAADLNLPPVVEWQAFSRITYDLSTGMRVYSTSVDTTALGRFTLSLPPNVVVSSFPGALLQQAGIGGASTSLTLTNVGEVATTVTLSREGTFFDVAPLSFALEPGASQVVSVTGLPQSVGELNGAVIVQGAGAGTTGLRIPIRLLSVGGTGVGQAVAQPSTNRVDLAAPPETGTSRGSIDYTNRGNGPLTGILVSDAPWLIPDPGIITIQPGETKRLEFTVDQSKRPDSESPIGSVAANLFLTYLSGSGSNVVAQLLSVDPFDGPGTSVAVVTVVYTVKPRIEQSTLPPLGASELALYLPGMGHVESSVGTFITDVSFVASPDLTGLTNLRMFYTPTGNDPAASTILTTIARLQPNQTVSFGDIGKSTFERVGETGTAQIRVASADAAKLTVGATVFNKSNPAGMYGSTIPVLRSDRAAGPGESIYMTGLLGSSASAHTNLVLQETAGFPASVQIEFLDPAGNRVSERTEAIGAFRVVRADQAVPAGAVTAVFTNAATSSGRFLAFATPVDKSLELDGTRKGGDTWVVADWARHYGYPYGDAVVIPVSGVVRGANNSYFRSDVSVFNKGAGTAAVRMSFYPDLGDVITRDVSIEPRKTVSYSDVMATLFGQTRALGYIRIDPQGGEISVSSRTYATVGSQIATFGTGVPAVSPAVALRKGGRRRIGGLDDANNTTINAATPATFRTNFGLLEVSGKPVTVKVTLFNVVPEGNSPVSVIKPSLTRELRANEFVLFSKISEQLLGSTRNAIKGNLKDLFVDFEVVDGEGAVMVFTSSIDNGTADQVLKLE